MSAIGIFVIVLLAIFIALKLANVIAWSWFWVFSPLIIYILIILLETLFWAIISDIFDF